MLNYCAIVLKMKHDVIEIPEFYKYLGSTYPKYEKQCKKSVFGNAYISKQLFSIMKYGKINYSQ